MRSLPTTFYARPTPEVARDLVGARLVHEHRADGRLVGRIVETEAYTQDDPAFRSWGVVDEATGLVKPEGRALTLFGPPGRAYVYLCYRYWLLNAVTEPEGRAGCVLIRAVEPLAGQAAMAARRAAAHRVAELTNGPGKLCQAFDIDGSYHGQSLLEPPLYIAEPSVSSDERIATSSRIGLHFGLGLQYRFFLEGHPCVSPGVPSDVAAARRRKGGGPPPRL
jgi:DNA-3-methyladenine glycosylase